jgi:P4 family phage/plasmid primase-like protien
MDNMDNIDNIDNVDNILLIEVDAKVCVPDVNSCGKKRGSFLTNDYTIEKYAFDDTKNNLYCFIPHKKEYYILMWDFDIKIETLKKTYSSEIIDYYIANFYQIVTNINNLIIETLKEIFIKPNTEYIMADKNIGLGYHIYYPNITINKQLHNFMYTSVFDKLKKKYIYDYDIIRGIFDELVSKGNGMRFFYYKKNNAYYKPNQLLSTFKFDKEKGKHFKYCLINSTIQKIQPKIKDTYCDFVESHKIKKNRNDRNNNNANNYYVGSFIFLDLGDKKKMYFELVDILKMERWNEYIKWTEIIFLFKTYNLYNEIIELSKKSKKFDRHSINIIDNIFAKKEEPCKKYQLGTLIRWASEDNNNETKNILKKYKTINTNSNSKISNDDILLLNNDIQVLNNDIQVLNNENMSVDINNYDVNLIKLFNALNPNRWTNLIYWFCTYCVFINEQINLELFHYYLKKYGEENYENYKNILKNFKISNGYKLSTLYKWLQEDNNNLFIELQKTRKDFWNLVLDMNHSDLAKLYFSLNPTKYIKSNATGWYEYNINNVLIHTLEVPNSLLNDLTNTIQNYIIEQRNLLLPNDEKYDEKMKLVKKSYTQMGNSSYTKGIIEYLKNLYTVDRLDDLIDNKHYLLAFDDYLYDIEQGKFREIQTNDYISKTTKYKAQIKSNHIIRNKINDLLFSIFSNNKMVEYWKIITGLSLFTNKMEKIFIHTGSGGNGKGLLTTILRSCLGDYFLTAENTFLSTVYKAGCPNPTLSSSKGIRYLFVPESENDKDVKFNVPFMKTITGGDELTCRNLYSKNITFKPQFVCNAQCNDKPELGKIDKGIVRRIEIINYPFSFVDNPSKNNERQKNYELKNLVNKDEFIREFILLLIEYAQEYYNKDISKIDIPNEVKYETIEYINDNNPMKEWLDKNIIITDDEKDMVKTTDIYFLYNNDANNEIKLDSKNIIKMMKFNGINIRPTKSCGSRVYYKIKFINNDDKKDE